MKLYPAIDLRGGQAVRLYQGDYDQMTVYNADPVAQAQQFIDAGAKYLHVVDLDGAKDDTTANLQTIAAIAKLGGLKIEVGGGIRDEARIQRYLDLGADRCILGTVAVKNFDFTAEMAQKYGAQIPAECGVLGRLEEPSEDELEDSFLRYAGDVKASRKEATAWHLCGTPEPDGFKNLVTLMVPAYALRSCSR